MLNRAYHTKLSQQAFLLLLAEVLHGNYYVRGQQWSKIAHASHFDEPVGVASTALASITMVAQVNRVAARKLVRKQ